MRRSTRYEHWADSLAVLSYCITEADSTTLDGSEQHRYVEPRDVQSTVTQCSSSQPQRQLLGPNSLSDP